MIVEATSTCGLTVPSQLIVQKGAMFYSKGWVRDLDKATKRQKQLTKQYQFLGSETIKKAYFGLPSSGRLSLFLPLSKLEMELPTTSLLPPAREFVDSVVLCETDLLKYHAAEATSDVDSVCRLKKDAYVSVDSYMAFLETFPSDVSPSCVFFRVPEGASLSPRDDVENRSPKGDDVEDLPEDQDNGSVIGISVKIHVRSDVGNFKQPCSLAHVLWREVTD